MGERRLVALIRKYPQWATQYATYSTGDPAWHPQLPPDHDPEAVDEDYLRKRAIEDRAAGY